MKRVTYILITIIILVGLRSNTASPAQMPDTRSVVRALYIYTFATLVEWPQEKRSGNFVIGVFGEISGVYSELTKKYSGKSIGSQEIVIKNYQSTQDISDLHILYVSPENTKHIKALSQTTIKGNTLLVSEGVGGLTKGAIVNFIIEGAQQKYEINKSNAKKHKLVIADKLSDLAANVIK
ncbi:MAG: hypothetical protein ACI8ZM_003315 [Crocinitomix sp.]